MDVGSRILLLSSTQVFGLVQYTKKVETPKVPTAYCGPKLGVNITKDLVVDGVGEEGDELGPGSLDAQGQGDGGQLLDGVQAQLKMNKE